MATLPYWNNGEVISSDKLNSMVASIIAGDPLAVKVSNATKNDVNQIVSYLSSLHDKAKTNLNSATSTSDLDTAYANMTALVSNKLGSYANDDTVDLYSTGIRASIITFLQAYDTMMSNDRLNNKNTDITLGRRIDSESQTRANNDNAINTKISDMQANGGGRNLAIGTGAEYAMGYGIPTTTWKDGYAYLKLPANTINSEVLPQAPHTFFYTLTKGTTYTQTIWFETDAKLASTSIQITWFTSAGHDAQPATLINLGENKYKLYSTYMWSGKSDNSVRLFDTFGLDYAFDLSTGTYFKFGKLMLEKGTIAHDWTPAPEDTNDAIENVNTKADANTASISKITSNGGGRNLLRKSTNSGYRFQPTMSRIDNYIIYQASTVYMEQGQQYTVHADASAGLVWSGTHNPNAESNNVVLWLTNEKDISQIISDANTGTGTTFTWNNPSGTYWLRVNTYKVDNSGYVDKVMLEKGIVAHDWTLAPEDTQSQIDNLNANKISSSDVNWNLVAKNSSNTYNYASGSKITLPNGSSITVKDDRIIPHINLPRYLTDYTHNNDLNTIATSCGECDNLFIPSAIMATLSNRPTNPDTNDSLTGDCFYTYHYAYSGTTVRAFQKIYSCDYNYVFIRSYNSSSGSWTNWSCLTPYA